MVRRRTFQSPSGRNSANYCFLYVSIAKQSNTMSYLNTTHDVYKKAAENPDVGLCCTTTPVWQLPGLDIPKAMLQMNYGCGSTRPSQGSGPLSEHPVRRRGRRHGIVAIFLFQPKKGEAPSGSTWWRKC